MTICVDAGLTFNAAMQRVSERWDDPLSLEFGRVIYEMQLGKSRRQALRDMSDRLDVPDVTSFLAAVLQAEQLGVGIGKVLRIQSEQMRVRTAATCRRESAASPSKNDVSACIFDFAYDFLLFYWAQLVSRFCEMKPLVGFKLGEAVF